MSLTVAQARDEMLTLITAAWTANAGGLPLFYDDRPGEPPTNGTGWARVNIQHNLGAQSTISNPIGNNLFRRDGLLTVQIFAPIGKGLSQADALAKVALDAFEGKSTPNGVWFRKVRMREIGPDKSWFNVNVYAEFNYDEAK